VSSVERFISRLSLSSNSIFHNKDKKVPFRHCLCAFQNKIKKLRFYFITSKINRTEKKTKIIAKGEVILLKLEKNEKKEVNN